MRETNVSVLETPPKTARTHGVGISILRYAPSRFVEPLLALITIPILTRVLEPSGYGNFKTLILTAGLARIIGFDWVNNCAIRFFRPMEDDPRRYHTNLFTGLLFGMGILGAAWLLLHVLASSVGMTDTSTGGLLLLLSAFAPWMFLTAVAEGFARNGEMMFRAMQRPWAFSIVRIVISLSRHGLGLTCLLLASQSMSAYFGGWAAGTLVIALFVWFRTGSWRHVAPRYVSTESLRGFVAFGFPITLVLLANSAQTTGIRYVLQYLMGPEATGLFSVAYELGGVPVLVLQSIVMLGLYPLAIDAFEKHGRIDGIIHDGLRYFFIGAVPVVLLLAMLARPSLTVFAGEAYSEAWIVLVISCAGTLAFGLSQYFSLAFLVTKRTGRWATINLTAAACNIICALWLVPRWGYVAAAVSTAGTQGLILLGATLWGVRPGRSNVPLTTLGYTVVACLPMILTGFLLKRFADLGPFAHCLTVCAVGGASYLSVLWAVGELRREREALHVLLRKLGTVKKAVDPVDDAHDS